MIVRQFHAVIKIFVGPADVQNVDKPGVSARDRFERGHSFELAQKRAFAFKSAAINNFYRAQRAGDCSRQPNLAISAAPDHAQQFVIGNDWDLSGNLFGNGGDFTQAMTARQFWGACAPQSYMSILAAEFLQCFDLLFQDRRYTMPRQINLT